MGYTIYLYNNCCGVVVNIAKLTSKIGKDKFDEFDEALSEFSVGDIEGKYIFYPLCKPTFTFDRFDDMMGVCSNSTNFNSCDVPFFIIQTDPLAYTDYEGLRTTVLSDLKERLNNSEELIPEFVFSVLDDMSKDEALFGTFTAHIYG